MTTPLGTLVVEDRETRSATVGRRTKETDVTVTLVLDGSGQTSIGTGIGFYDHLLSSFGHHGLFDLTIEASGDLDVDEHHTVEDVALVLGAAFAQALGERAGISRFGDSSVPMDELRKAPAPRVNETMVLDTRARREMFEQAAAAGERSQLAPERLRVPTLTILRGRTDQKEYRLSGKLTVIGRSSMATVRLRGWFTPSIAAQINKHEDGYYLGRGDLVPKVNGVEISGLIKLNHGDLIEVGRVHLKFLFRE